MSTAKSIIDRAAMYISVKRQGIDLTAEEYAAALDTLNDFLLELQARNIKFPLTIVADINDDVGEWDWTRSYIKTQLAMRMAMEYTVEIPGALLKMAKEAKRSVYANLTDLSDVAKPDTLPVGSGNEMVGYGNDQFYQNNYKGKLKTASGMVLDDEQGEAITTRNNGRGLLNGQ